MGQKVHPFLHCVLIRTTTSASLPAFPRFLSPRENGRWHLYSNCSPSFSSLSADARYIISSYTLQFREFLMHPLRYSYAPAYIPLCVEAGRVSQSANPGMMVQPGPGERAGRCLIHVFLIIWSSLCARGERRCGKTMAARSSVPLPRQLSGPKKGEEGVKGPGSTGGNSFPPHRKWELKQVHAEEFFRRRKMAKNCDRFLLKLRRKYAHSYQKAEYSSYKKWRNRYGRFITKRPLFPRSYL